MDTLTNYYPAFQHPAEQLSAFACCLGIFTISLKNGSLISFRPDDAEDFKGWLMAHDVRYISTCTKTARKRRRT